MSKSLLLPTLDGTFELPMPNAPRLDHKCCSAHAWGRQTPDGRCWCWGKPIGTPRPYPDDLAVIANIRATARRWRKAMQRQPNQRSE